MPRTMRRVVTGIDENGKSVFVSDEVLEAVMPPSLGGNEIFVVGGSDEQAVVPTTGEVEQGLRFFPMAPEGYRFVIFTYPPEAEMTVPEDADAAWAETERLTPGMGDAVADPGGMHYTATVDLEYVLEGEFTLTLDDGVSKVLKAGDSLIQFGAKHSWANKGDVPATMLLVFVGAKLEEDRFGEHRGGNAGDH
jgi:mannose-6-phosphate isomerase-like protein (cupin superfamily)